MVAIAIVAAAGWLALYLGFAAVTSDQRLRRGIRRFRLDGGPPDLVIRHWWLTGTLGRSDRLTVAGAALAAWAARVTAQQAPPGITEPDRLALAVATDGGPPVPGLEHVRRGDVRDGGHRGSMTTAATQEQLARAPKAGLVLAGRSVASGTGWATA